jgi:hypothetical protein
MTVHQQLTLAGHTSLERIQADLSHAVSEPVHVFLAGRQGPVEINGQGTAKLSLAAQERAVQSALRAQPGTLHAAAQAIGQINVPGLSGQLSLTGFGGDASWAGYAMISGHWYSGPGQVDVTPPSSTTPAPRSAISTCSPPAASTPWSRSPARSSTWPAGSPR